MSDNLRATIGYTAQWLKANGIKIPSAVRGDMIKYRIHAIKSQEDYQNELSALVAALIAGTITKAAFEKAYSQLIADYMGEAWAVGGADGLSTASLDALIQDEQSHVKDFATAIITAGALTDGITARIALWANRYQDAVNRAAIIAGVDNGDNMVWVYGDTIDHCSTCAACKDIVASADEWSAAGDLGFRPQAPDLECGGWNCLCSIVPTDEKRNVPDGMTLPDYILSRGA